MHCAAALLMSDDEVTINAISDPPPITLKVIAVLLCSRALIDRAS